MKTNVWNVKDILNLPMNTGGAKPGKGGTTGEYSSLPDSQFLFGSQTWPENSQSFSQEISGQSRGSQQASQEVNEMKVSANYHLKPMLFGESRVANSSGGRTMGILDRFEEEKRKAKEIEILIGVRELHESLENVKKTFLNCIDGSCDITRAAVAEGMDHFRKIIQDNFATVKESIASQTELLMSQTQRELKDSEAKTSLALKDLSSIVLSIQQDLESLKLEQSKEKSLLEKILSLLGSIMSAHSAGAHPGLARMIDNTVQTSPALMAQLCVVSNQEHYYEGMEAFNYPEERVAQSICPVKNTTSKKLSRGLTFQVIGTQPGEKQRLVTKRSYTNDWEKSYHLSSVTASSSSPMAASTVTTLVKDSKRNYIAGGPVYMDPVKSLSDINKDQSGTWIEVPREKKVLKRAQRFQTSRKKKRALILPQRRPNQGAALNNAFMDNKQDENQENRVPQSVVSAYQKPTKAVSENQLPLQQQIRTRSMNTSERGQHLEPWSWSESSNSSQVIVEYQTAEWEAVKPVQNANTIQKPRVTWQLLDFISDSD